MAKKFVIEATKEGMDVKLKKSGSVNPVIMVRQFSNILKDIKAVQENENELKSKTAKERRHI